MWSLAGVRPTERRLRRRRSVAASTLLLLLVALSSCTADLGGNIAVSMEDGELKFAVLRCDKTDLDQVEVTGPRTSPNKGGPIIARWSAGQRLKRIAELNTTHLGTSWRAEVRLPQLKDDVKYTAYAFEENSGTMTSEVEFSLAELRALKSGEWLYTGETNKVTTDLKWLSKWGDGSCR